MRLGQLPVTVFCLNCAYLCVIVPNYVESGNAKDTLSRPWRLAGSLLHLCNFPGNEYLPGDLPPAKPPWRQSRKNLTCSPFAISLMNWKPGSNSHLREKTHDFLLLRRHGLVKQIGMRCCHWMGLEAYSDLTDQLRLQTSVAERVCSSMLTKGTVTLSQSMQCNQTTDHLA